MPRRRGNREGSISKRPDGRWQGRVTVGGGRRKAVYGRTREEVAHKLAVLLKAVHEGATVPTGRLTVGAWVREWLETVKGTVKPRTWQRYEGLLVHHALPALGKVPLTRLTPERLERLYRDKLAEGLAPRSVHHLHVVLGTALAKAVRRRHLAENPARLAEPPRIPRYQPRVLTPEETRALLEAAADDRLEALYYVLAYTGVRLGEALALRWSAVDLAASTLRVEGTLQRHPGGGLVIEEPKTSGSRRTIRLAPAAVAALERHRVRQLEERLHAGELWAGLDLVFCTEIGTPLEASNVRRRSFWPLLEKLGLADKVTTTETRWRRGKQVEVERTVLKPLVTLHALRHGVAHMLLKAGEPVSIVSAMLGHARTSTTTDTYGYLVGELTAAAAERLQQLIGDAPTTPEKGPRRQLVSKLVSRRTK